MIKVGIRHNLLYPSILIVCDFFRNIDLELLLLLYNYNYSFLFTIIMFFSELAFGLIIYLYQSQFFKIKKQKKIILPNGIELVTIDNSKIPTQDSILKINVIIFLIVLFDYFQFSIPFFFY